VSEYWFNKDQNRIRDLRADTLSQMMNIANVQPGGRYIAVDDASGMLVSGILERLGGAKLYTFWFLVSDISRSGDGRLITVCDVDSPPAYPVVVHMNFKKDAVSPVLSSLNWSTVQEDYTPSRYLRNIMKQAVSQSLYSTYTS
jgi:tRNA (adenine-N(1)-)-methyltransferase non-catalytic subunit